MNKLSSGQPQQEARPKKENEIEIKETDMTKLDRPELIKIVKEKDNTIEQMKAAHEQELKVYQDRLKQIQDQLKNTTTIANNIQEMNVNRLRHIRDFIDIELTDLRKGVEVDD